MVISFAFFIFMLRIKLRDRHAQDTRLPTTSVATYTAPLNEGYCFLFETASLYTPGWPRIFYVKQADCKLPEIHLLLPLQCWDYTHVPPNPENI